MTDALHFKIVNRRAHAFRACTLPRMRSRSKTKVPRHVKRLLKKFGWIIVLRTTQTDADNTESGDFFHLCKRFRRSPGTVIANQICDQCNLDSVNLI